MNFIVGATGKLGMEICRLLREQNKPVRAFARKTSDSEKVDQLRALGAEIAYGDLRDSNSLADATRGVTTVITTATTGISQDPGATFDSVDIAGYRALNEAAKANGVAHFIYTSLSGNIVVSSPLFDSKRTIENDLKQSGLTYTILRPSAFQEFWLTQPGGIDVANRKATVFGDGKQVVSYMSMSDVAKFAVACVDRPAARNRTIELGGPDAVSPLDVVAMYEKATGSRFDVQFVTLPMLQAQYAAAQNDTQKTIAGVMLGKAYSDAVPMEDVSAEFGIQPFSVRAFIERAVGRAVS